MSSFTDTKAREKVVDFVDYFKAGTSFYENATGGPTVTGLASLCGLKVSVEKGTTEETDATGAEQEVHDGGQASVTVCTYNDQNAANLAISSGHAQVGMADSPVAAYQVKQSNGQFKLVGTALRRRAVRHRAAQGQRDGAGRARRGQGLIADGTYAPDPEEVGRAGGRDHHTRRSTARSAEPPDAMSSLSDGPRGGRATTDQGGAGPAPGAVGGGRSHRRAHRDARAHDGLLVGQSRHVARVSLAVGDRSASTSSRRRSSTASSAPC